LVYFQDLMNKSRRKTIIAVTAAIMLRVSLCCAAIGSFLAARMGIQAASGRNRFSRFLRNPAIDVLAFLRAGIRFHASRMRPLPIIIDWTDWPGSWRYLVVSVPVGTRGMVIFARGLQLPVPEGSQNAMENEVVAEILAEAAWCGVDVLFLADRGFRRRSLLKRLEGKRSAYVVRLCGKQTINRRSAGVLLKDIIKGGQARDLGVVGLGSQKHGRLRVRIVAVWDKSQEEPWLLATNIRAPVAEVVALYDRRFAGIEHPFRDTLGNRYGLQMEWHRIPNGPRLELAFCMAGLAALGWTAVGAEAKELDPTLAFASTTKGDGYSLLHIGQERCRAGAMPKVDRRFLKRHLPLVSFRIFPIAAVGAVATPKPWHKSVLTTMRHTVRHVASQQQAGRRSPRTTRVSPKKREQLAAMLS